MIMRKKEAQFKPKAAAYEGQGEAAPITEDELKEAAIQKQDELQKQDKKSSVVTKISAVWTIIFTLYAIVTTGIFIGRGWVSHVASIVLASILGVYVCIFIVLVVFTFKDAKGGTKQVKLYRKTLKIFKAIANVVLLSLSAVSMVGMSFEGIDQVAKLIFFIATFVVAVIQLGLKVTLFVMKLIRMKIAKAFKVEFYQFVDGRKKRKSIAMKYKESKYKNK